MSDSYQTRALRILMAGCQTLSEIAQATGMTHRQVSNAAAGLIAKGLAERVEIGCYRLTAAGEQLAAEGGTITSGPNAPLCAPRAPRSTSLRQRAWSAMRLMQSFTVDDLLIAATNGAEKDARGNLLRYCKALADAGILRQMRRRVRGTKPTSNGFVRYQLLRDLGSHAPSLSHKESAIHDHNPAPGVMQ